MDWINCNQCKLTFNKLLNPFKLVIFLFLKCYSSKNNAEQRHLFASVHDVIFNVLNTNKTYFVFSNLKHNMKDY